MKEIIEHLHREGYPVNDFIPDSKPHRFEIERGDRHSGFYIAHRNFLIKSGEEWFHVSYGSWRDGIENAKSFSTLKGILTTEDRTNLEKQIAKDKKSLDKIREEGYETAAEEALRKWQSLSATGASEYLSQKKISDCPNLGIKYDNFNQAIYVPLRDGNGKLWSLQRIDRNGKRFHPGGRVRGNFHLIGDPGKKIYICEGFATACSVHLATNQAVVVAFDSGNLKKTASAIKGLHPEKTIVLCGDDDKYRDDNVGRKCAEDAARNIGVIAIFPRFRDESSQPTDWNDLHSIEGLDEIAEQLSQTTALRTIEQMSAFDIMNAPYPDENEKTFSRKGTIANVNELMRRLQVIVRYNVISKEEEILIPGKGFSTDNRANATLAHIVSWCERVRIPTGNLGSYLTAIAESNLYNPVATWITSESWDGESRLDVLYKTITARGESSDPVVRVMKETLMKRWLVSAVAAAFETEGVSAHGVLVFQGRQDLGKTYWFKKLAPAEFRADGLSLRPDDKDSVFGIISNWLVELGELDATFRKSDIAQLKAFITRDKDIIRRPYARKESHYARRTVFFGSVNETDFLKDVTGNRRFWTIECEKIDYRHNIDVQQLWAEVYELYRRGESWTLDSEELRFLNNHNEKFEVIEPVVELLQSCLEWEHGLGCRWLTATEVCREVGIHNPDGKQVKSVAKAIRKISKESRIQRGVSQYFVPRLRIKI